MLISRSTPHSTSTPTNTHHHYNTQYKIHVCCLYRMRQIQMRHYWLLKLIVPFMRLLWERLWIMLIVLDQYENITQHRCRLKWIALYGKSTLEWVRSRSQSPCRKSVHRVDLGPIRTLLICASHSFLSEWHTRTHARTHRHIHRSFFNQSQTLTSLPLSGSWLDLFPPSNPDTQVQ